MKKRVLAMLLVIAMVFSMSLISMNAENYKATREQAISEYLKVSVLLQYCSNLDIDDEALFVFEDVMTDLKYITVFGDDYADFTFYIEEVKKVLNVFEFDNYELASCIINPSEDIQDELLFLKIKKEYCTSESFNKAEEKFNILKTIFEQDSKTDTEFRKAILDFCFAAGNIKYTSDGLKILSKDLYDNILIKEPVVDSTPSSYASFLSMIETLLSLANSDKTLTIELLSQLFLLIDPISNTLDDSEFNEAKDAYKNIKNLNESDFISDNWQAFLNAKSDFKKAIDDNNVISVRKLNKILYSSIEALSYKPKVALKDLVDYCREKFVDTDNTFDHDSWVPFKEAYDKALLGLTDPEKTDSEYSSLFLKLKETYSSLLGLGIPPFKNEYEKYYEQLAILNEVDYTPKTWKDVTDAIGNLKQLIDSGKFTSEEIDSHCLMVDEAFKNLQNTLSFIVRSTLTGIKTFIQRQKPDYFNAEQLQKTLIKLKNLETAWRANPQDQSLLGLLDDVNNSINALQPNIIALIKQFKNMLDLISLNKDLEFLISEEMLTKIKDETARLEDILKKPSDYTEEQLIFVIQEISEFMMNISRSTRGIYYNELLALIKYYEAVSLNVEVYGEDILKTAKAKLDTVFESLLNKSVSDVDFEAIAKDTISYFYGYIVAHKTGDLTNDGKIAIDDAMLVFRAVAGKEELAPRQLDAANVSETTESVSIQDAMSVFRFVAGKTDSFENELSEFEEFIPASDVFHEIWSKNIVGE